MITTTSHVQSRTLLAQSVHSPFKAYEPAQDRPRGDFHPVTTTGLESRANVELAGIVSEVVSGADGMEGGEGTAHLLVRTARCEFASMLCVAF